MRCRLLVELVTPQGETLLGMLREQARMRAFEAHGPLRDLRRVRSANAGAIAAPAFAIARQPRLRALRLQSRHADDRHVGCVPASRRS
jgi:hypothetical protein